VRVATDNGSVPAFHRFVRTYDRGRALLDPLAIIVRPGPATIPTLVFLLVAFCAIAFPLARIRILFDDAPIPARLLLWVVARFTISKFAAFSDARCESIVAATVWHGAPLCCWVTGIGSNAAAVVSVSDSRLKAHLLAKFVVPPVEDIRIFFPCIWPNIFDGVVASALAVESILAGDLAGQTHVSHVRRRDIITNNTVIRSRRGGSAAWEIFTSSAAFLLAILLPASDIIVVLPNEGRTSSVVRDVFPVFAREGAMFAVLGPLSLRRKHLAAHAVGARVVHIFTGFVRVGIAVDSIQGSVACDIVMGGDDEVRRREKGGGDEDDGSETHLASFAGLGLGGSIVARV